MSSWKKATRGSTEVFTRSTKELPPSDTEDARIIVISSESFCRSKFKVKMLPLSTSNFEVFYDRREKEWFITNYVSDDGIHDFPVSAIECSKDSFEVFVAKTRLSMCIDQVLPKCLKVEFYSDQLMISGNFEPPKKKSKKYGDEKVYKEGKGDAIDSGSVEYGVFTGSMSELSASSPRSAAISEEFDDQNLMESEDLPETQPEASQPDEYVHEFHLPKAITTSKIDKKASRKLEIYNIKQAISTLLEKTRNSGSEILVSMSKISMSSMKIDENDKIVKRMVEEIKENRVVDDVDPIIVTEKDGVFNVLSGSKRVSAYKLSNVSKIGVSKINSQESKTFPITQYFANSDRVPDSDLMLMFRRWRQLLKYLQISVKELKKWTSKELKDAFQEILEQNKAFEPVLRICLEEELCDAVMSALTKGLNVSIEWIKTISRKFKQNPTSTIELLRTDDLEHLDHKKLSEIQPDTCFMLCQKQIDPMISEELALEYRDDPLFTKFVKSADLRSLGTNVKESIKIRFNSVKRKRSVDDSVSVQISIIFTKTPTYFDVYVSTDEIQIRKAIKTSRTMIGLGIGFQSEEKSSGHLLSIPDDLATVDSFGQLQNCVNVSLFVKSEGKVRMGAEVSEFLGIAGVSNKLLFTSDDLRKMFVLWNTIVLESDGLLTPAFACSIIPERATVYVNRKSTKAAMEKFLSQSSSDTLYDSPLAT